MGEQGGPEKTSGEGELSRWVHHGVTETGLTLTLEAIPAAFAIIETENSCIYIYNLLNYSFTQGFVNECISDCCISCTEIL